MGRTSQNPSRPPASVVDALRNLPTSVVADVIDGSGATMDHDIGPLGPPSLCGTALTVRAPPGDNLTVHEALTVARSGDVLVVDAGGDEEVALWGELLSTSAAAHDLAGTVVDGAVRDVADIDDVGYPVYARAASPNGPVKEAAGEIGTPVTCGGVTVRTGDVVIGDADGIAVVDAERAARVAEDAAAKLEREAELQSRAADGEYLYELLDLDDLPRAERPVAGDEDSDAGE